MIPVFQGFLFGGGVNPFASRVATYFLRDNLAEHVGVLVDVYRAKRDAMLKGLWEVLGKTDVEISKPEGGFFIWIKLPTGTDPQAPRRDRGHASGCSTRRARASSPTGAASASSASPTATSRPQRCYEGSRRIARGHPGGHRLTRIAPEFDGARRAGRPAAPGAAPVTAR